MLTRSSFKLKVRQTYERPERVMPWPERQTFAESPRCDAMGTPDPKTVQQRNPNLLAMARGKPCLLCVPGVCNHNSLTTVACHSNSSIHGKGGARKADDHYSVWGCSACHLWLDQGPALKHIKQATFMRGHLDQVLAWRRIVSDMSNSPKTRQSAHWALCLLMAGEVGNIDINIL